MAANTDFELSIERNLEPGSTQRGFRWKLTSNAEQWPLISKDAFATRREAEREGEAALRRARERGRLR
jgi:hypothetical protein